MRFILCLVTLSLLALNSCEPTRKNAQTEDDTNPFFRQAAKYEADGNHAAAIKEYEKALQANPLGSRAHKEMATIYGDKLGDFVSAIYHYQRYLDAKPDAEDKELIQSLSDKAKQDFGLTLTFSPQQNAEEAARISKENVELKQGVALLQKQLAERDAAIAQLKSGGAAPVVDTSSVITNNVPATNAAPVTTDSKPTTTPAQPSKPATPAAVSTPATPAAPAVAAKPAAPSAPARSHVIATGDSLWKIAKKYYPEDVKEGMEKIKQANPEATSNPKNLKLGTTLVIP